VNPEVELLGLWSVGVQLATVTLLAAFFVALARTVRLQEVSVWAIAWVADAISLASLFLGMVLGPPPLLLRLSVAAYVAGKTAYALLLVAGARNHLRPGADEPLRPRTLAVIVAAWSLILSFLSPEGAFVRVAVSLMVGVLLTTGAAWVLTRPRLPRSRWLGFAMLLEGLLFLHYVPLTLPSLWGGQPLAGYVRYSSLFDAGVELSLALAILVAIEGSSSQHLEHLNRELLESQNRLRQLVDLDPLTSLANRRRLRGEMERVRTSGAAVVFLDVDNFKEINDRHGHIAGDACLLRIAASLTKTFRSDDSLFRLGGDEFLVVAPGLDPQAARERVERLRADLAEAEGNSPPCHLSVGIANLVADGEPDAALREADDLMYVEKRRVKGQGERHRGGVLPETLV
jgi:diguanylate cyclase (GGDEF)-like protein